MELNDADNKHYHVKNHGGKECRNVKVEVGKVLCTDDRPGPHTKVVVTLNEQLGLLAKNSARGSERACLAGVGPILSQRARVPREDSRVGEGRQSEEHEHETAERNPGQPQNGMVIDAADYAINQDRDKE